MRVQKRGRHRQWEPCWSLAALRRAGVKNKEGRAFCSAPAMWTRGGCFLKNLERPPGGEKQGELSLRDLVEDFVWTTCECRAVTSVTAPL